MKIILDAMGGDNAPQAVVQGALEAHAQCGADIVLVGREEAIRACLDVYKRQTVRPTALPARKSLALAWPPAGPWW